MARGLVGTSGYVYRGEGQPFPHARHTEAMLRADAARIAAWTRDGHDVVYFNDDGRAAAVRNARRLAALLEAGAARRRAA
jgi:uncharacterized protein YecE (DUF72 family)